MHTLPSPAAVHEAGHCIQAIAEGLPVLSVSLDCTGGGLVDHGDLGSFNIASVALMRLAGPLAEADAFGLRDAASWREDLAFVAAVMAHFAAEDAVPVETHLAECRAIVRETLARHRAGLMVLAYELDRRGKLSGDEMRRAVAAAQTALGSAAFALR